MAFEMTKRYFVLTLAILLVSSSFATTLGFVGENEETRTAHVEINGLNDLSVIRDVGGKIIERKGKYVLVEGTSSTFSFLEARGMKVKVIDEIDQKPINNTEPEKQAGYPFADHYPSVNELYSWYDNLTNTYPDLVEKHHYGNSWKGGDLWALEITSNEDTQVEEKPGVLVDGGIHAREWSGPQVSSYYMWRILDEYDTNETINWLVNNRRLFVIPMTNPDGYIHDGNGDLGDDGQGEAWRKNRNESVGSTDEVGVDLNRNWDIDFGGAGTSDDPSSDQYHGEGPFSEYETYHLKEFILEQDIDSYHNIHSHAGTLLIPYMYTNDACPHDDWYRGMADHMTSFTSKMGDESEQYSYGQPEEEIGYSAAGGASDWAYSKEGLQGLTFEVYTPDSGRGGFYPAEENIMTINKDLDDSLIYQARVADVELGDGPMGDGGQNLFPPVPYLVYGEVESEEGDPVSNLTVEAESQETGEKLSIETDSNGYYELNFGNLVNEGYSVGDSFSIEAGDVSKSFTVGDKWGRREDLTLGTIPPSIDITRPSGGEVWSPGGEEDINWGTTEGTGAITRVDLEYSVDNGSSWSYIAQGLDDTGSYTWTVPNEQTEKAQIRATVHDDNGLSGEDVSETFTIEDGGVEEYTLTIDKEGQGVTDPITGNHTYTKGDDVTVTATPDEGWSFVEWTGDRESTEDQITIVMDSDKQITAHFQENGTTEMYELTVNTNGEGTVEIDPDQNEYEEGTEVTLTAMPAEGWHFDGWTGDHNSTDKETVIIMDDNKIITANFKENNTDQTYELTVNTNGEGTVNIDPDQNEYDEGTEVTLTAMPAEGWHFDEWTGDRESTEEQITIVMDSDKQITAHFQENGTTETYELTVNTNGEGTVEINPDQNEYEEGTEVTLTAEPAEGWYFEEWTDEASGTEEQITVTMDDNKEVTANFAIHEYDLTINIEGQGSTDPSEGTHTYEHGEKVTIEPTPEKDWNFKEWTGDRQSQEKEITIEMDENKEITAHFEESNPYFEVDITGYKGEVEAGDTVTVRYAVENTGEVEGTQDIILKIDGEEKETNKDLTLGPGEDYTDEFKVVLKEEGTHEIEIASSDMNKAEDVEVEVAQTKDTSGPLSDYWWLIVVLMIGIIAAIALVYMMSGGDEEEEGPPEQPPAPPETEPIEKPAEEE